MCLSLFLNCRILIMPYIKTSPKKLPLTKQLDLKAQKCGLRHTVFAPNGDQYTGEWLDDRKHGETPGRGQPSLWPRFFFFYQTDELHSPFIPEGKGTQLWKKTGAAYRGEWKCGQCDGYGTFSVLVPGTNKYDRKYCGRWKNGKKHVSQCAVGGSHDRGRVITR